MYSSIRSVTYEARSHVRRRDFAPGKPASEIISKKIDYGLYNNPGSTSIFILSQAYINVWLCVCTHRYILDSTYPTYTHTNTHSHARVSTHTLTYTHTHTYARAHIQTYVDT